MTVFYTWPFPADKGSYAGTDTRVNRTLPVRLSEIVNVKDWGAVGDSSTNDYAAIQAAINFCIAQGGGKVFFPAGQYNCPTNLVVGSDTDNDAFVQLIGGGGGGATNTLVYGTGTGWFISKGTKTYDLIQRIEGLGVTNGGAGCIKITGQAVQIKNCYMNGLVLVDASQADGATISDCGGAGADPPDATAAGPYVFSTTGVGVYLGDNCMITNCRFPGSNWITFALSGTGASVIGCSTEVTYTAVRVGWAPDANPAVIGGGRELEAVGCIVSGLQTEAQTVTCDLFNARACLIMGNFFSGGVGTSVVAPITALSWSGGTATATSTGHNLPAGTSILQLNINGLTAPTAWRPSEFTTVTKTSSSQFTYPIVSDPGAAPSYAGTGWAWPSLYSLRCRKVSECVIIGNQNSLDASVASVDMVYGTTPSPYNASTAGEAIHSHNVMVGMSGARGWLRPTGENAAGWKFINCGVDATTLGSNPSADPSPIGSLVFTDLPGQFTNTNDQWQGGPYEAQEFDISDGAKSGGGAAVWGDTVEGGSTGKYKVRYDGSVWKRIG